MAHNCCDFVLGQNATLGMPLVHCTSHCLSVSPSQAVLEKTRIVILEDTAAHEDYIRNPALPWQPLGLSHYIVSLTQSAGHAWPGVFNKLKWCRFRARGTFWEDTSWRIEVSPEHVLGKLRSTADLSLFRSIWPFKSVTSGELWNLKSYWMLQARFQLKGMWFSGWNPGLPMEWAANISTSKLPFWHLRAHPAIRFTWTLWSMTLTRRWLGNRWYKISQWLRPNRS